MKTTLKNKTKNFEKRCYQCGKSFTAHSNRAFYCSKACKREQEKVTRHAIRDGLRPAVLEKRAQVPEYVPVAYQILSITGAMNSNQLTAALKDKGYQVSKEIANICDYHGYLLSEDDAGLLYPFEVRANAMAGG